MLCDILKGLLNILTGVCAGFDVFVELELFAKSFCFALFNLPLFFQVSHIAYQVDQNVLLCVVLNLGVPNSDILKRLAPRDVKYDHDRMGILVENPSDASEGFLACSVPNLQLYE